MSVSEIAYDTGFRAPSYFAKCFKDEYGMSPGEVRGRKIKINHEKMYYFFCLFMKNINFASKKRFTMMLRKKSNPWVLSKSLYVIPMALVALSTFAASEYEQASGNGEAVAATANKGVEAKAVVTEKAERTAAMMPVQKADTISSVGVVGYSGTSSDNGNKVYEAVDEMPSYEGGTGELMRYLSENVHYPQAAQSNGVSGRIVVQFVVEKDGRIMEISVVRSMIDKCSVAKDGEAQTVDGATGKKSISESEYNRAVRALEGEAIRVVSQMKPWKPGKIKGEPVRVKYNIPLAFRLK